MLKLLGFASSEQAPTAAMPEIRISDRFMSPAEANFYRVLIKVVGDRGHVLAQVSLRQLLYLPGSNKSNPGRAAWQNKIAARSVDFLVCHSSTLRPLVVIELDEETHTKPERQTRDEEVEAVLRAAGLPLLRVLADRSYDTRELDATLAPYLMDSGLRTRT